MRILTYGVHNLPVSSNNSRRKHSVLTVFCEMYMVKELSVQACVYIYRTKSQYTRISINVHIILKRFEMYRNYFCMLHLIHTQITVFNGPDLQKQTIKKLASHEISHMAWNLDGIFGKT
jgi:hypothetical protein